MRSLGLLLIALLLSSATLSFAQEPVEAPMAAENEPESVAQAPVVYVAEAPYDPYAEPVHVKTPAELQSAQEEASWGYGVAVVLVLLFLALCTVDGWKNGCTSILDKEKTQILGL